jgi:septin family protein
MRGPQDQRRRMPLTSYEDSRVDACLYFIAPHNLRPLDLALMRRIGALTPVVPIIAKVPLL